MVSWKLNDLCVSFRWRRTTFAHHHLRIWRGRFLGFMNSNFQGPKVRGGRSKTSKTRRVGYDFFQTKYYVFRFVVLVLVSPTESHKTQLFNETWFDIEKRTKPHGKHWKVLVVYQHHVNVDIFIYSIDINKLSNVSLGWKKHGPKSMESIWI